MSDKYIKALRRMALDGSLDEKTAETLLKMRDAQWEESKHPRGKGGKFAPKGSGSVSGGSESESSGGSSGGSSGTMKEPSSAAASGFNYSFRSQIQRKAVERSNRGMARECERRAREWPEGSHERKIYNNYAKSLSEPMTGRPTKEKSEETTKKFLSNISPKLKPYAVERYKKDLANEPQITNDICDIADELGTGMFGLDYRLKKASDNDEGVCRIDEKIRETIKEEAEKGKTVTYEEATDRLGDLVRYTQACTADNLESNANKTLEALEKKGYKIAKVKNTWQTYNEKNPYRGVNCTIVSPTGTRFELQFHTAESLVCKEVQHGWYEEARTESTPQARKDELNKRMYQNAISMKEPKNIGNLKSRKIE